ncbi:MAG: hypothetical protein V1684_02370 [bacterium]
MSDNNELMLDVGQANEFKLVCRRFGFTNTDIKKMCKGDILDQFKLVIRGQAKIIVLKHLIDCDADPFIPKGWTLEEHKKGGQFQFDPTKIELFLSQKQQKGEVIEGNKLREELMGKPVLNANVLEYLLVHPELIPEEWKGKWIYFWGTIYRNSGGNLCVRCLRWRGSQWFWHDDWLGYGWDGVEPAAVLA